MLGKLIHPLKVDAFLSKYWEKKPVHVRRPLPDWCAGMPSIDDLDSIISLTSAYERRPNELRLVRATPNGLEDSAVERLPDGRPDMASVYRSYAQGATVVVNGLHARSAAVQQLASSIAAETGRQIGVNLYFSPPASQGFQAHTDGHDVILLQLEGSKVWRVFAPQYELPLEDQPVQISPDTLGPPVLEATVKPGHILYIPRGFIHEGIAGSGPSIHLTIGFHVARWVDLLEAGLRAAAENDSYFRRTAPVIDSLNDSLADEIEREFAFLLERLKGRSTAVKAIERFAAVRDRNSNSPMPHFKAIEGSRRLSGKTVVVRRPGLRCRVAQGGTRVRIEFGTRSVSAPLAAAPALQFISAHREFRVRDLPNALSESSKVVLVRRLIHEGFLTLPV